MSLKDQAYYDSIYKDLLKDKDFTEEQARETVQSIQEVDNGAETYTAEEIRKSIYQLKKVGYATV